jgi:hypothetical protein
MAFAWAIFLIIANGHAFQGYALAQKTKRYQNKILFFIKLVSGIQFFTCVTLPIPLLHG